MKRVAIEIGMRTQGLTVCRLLGSAGWKVYCLCSYQDFLWKEATYCKYIKNRVEPFDSSSELISKIERIKKENVGKYVEVFITSATWLAKLREEMPQFWDLYHVSSRPIEALNVLANKCDMYNYCRELGLPTVKDVVYPEYEEGSIKYPIVVKHNVESIHIENKCVKVDNEEDLKNVIESIPKQSRPYLILQEYIGADFIELDFRGYVDHGCIVGYSVVESLRAEPIGISTCLEEVTDATILTTIEAMTKKILADLDYTGFVGMDMKYRKTDGMCYILDINPRAPSSLSEWVMKYERRDLDKLFSGEALMTSLTPIRAGISWVNIFRDLKARRKHHDWKDLWKLVTAKYDVWDKHDPMPFIMMLLLTLYRKIRRQDHEPQLDNH